MNIHRSTLRSHIMALRCFIKLCWIDMRFWLAALHSWKLTSISRFVYSIICCCSFDFVGIFEMNEGWLEICRIVKVERLWCSRLWSITPILWRNSSIMWTLFCHLFFTSCETLNIFIITQIMHITWYTLLFFYLLHFNYHQNHHHAHHHRAHH